jgi:uncharacterized protein
MRKSSILIGLAVIAVVVFGVTIISSLLQPATTGKAAALQSVSTQSVPFIQGQAGQASGISVSGQGSITVVPDLARVTLGIEVSNNSAAAAQQDAASKMDGIVSQLKQQGIQDKDIQTVRFDLSPDYDYSTRTPVLKGYKVTNLVVVTLRDISKVGSLLDAVVASGATRLQGISFSTSDPAAAGTQGREEAIKNARTKADQLAKLAGVSLGAPISIEETVSAPPTPMDIAPKIAAAPSMGAAVQTPINPGTQEITTIVHVVYGIK